MDLLSDILLAAGALGAGVYCFVLSRRLQRFNDLENGVGGAVSVLASQAKELKATLESAQRTAAASERKLTELNERAQETSRRLELQMASLHDIPSTPSDPSAAGAKLNKNQRLETGPDGLMFIRHGASDQ